MKSHKLTGQPASPEPGFLIDAIASRQAEEVLLKAGALQSAIFNSANFSSIATDARGVIQIFNVGAERMLGYAASEVVNKITPADISDPQEVIARARALSAELSTPILPGFEALVFKASRGIEDIYELTYIRKDNSRFPAVVSVTALRDDQDAIIGYLLIGTDNTARKLAEEALLEAGALQNAIFNSANFSSIATDASGVIQIFNVGAERMLGYAASDVVNKITPADISDPQEVIARARALSAELSTPILPGFEALVFKASRGIEDIYELTYIRKDNSRFPAVVSVTALRDALGDIIGYLLIGTDNTARKQIEAEQEKLGQRLRDQQFYTRSLFESNIDALITTDPHGIITDVNKQMEALTGCTRDELIGAPFKHYFTDPERAGASVKQVLNEKKITNYELTARARDGKETVVSYNATTFYDRDRKLQGVFAAARDVTERKQNELVQNALYRITQTAITSDGIDALYHSIHAILGKLIPAENFFIALYDAANELITFSYYMDQYKGPSPAPTPIQGLTGYVIRTGRPLLATREVFDRLVQLGEVEAVGGRSGDWLGVPLKVEGRMIGVMAVQSYNQGIHFKQEDMDLLEFVSTQVAQVIERKRLEEEIRSLSLTDELTGLYNRRGFNLLAEQQIKLAHRLKGTLLLFFGDLDYLKAINDTWGHAHGDLALKELSAILKHTFRESDIVARIGGDEFVILAEDGSKEIGELMAHRIQSCLDARNQQGDESYHLSISLGIARYNPDAPCTISELISQADGLMYHEKQAKKEKNKLLF